MKLWQIAGKAITGAIGALASASAAGLIGGQLGLVVSGLLIIASAVGVYHAPYKPTTLSGK